MLRSFAAPVALVALLGLVAVTDAAKLKVGDPAPAFRNLETTTGTRIALSDFTQEVLVLCITCNHCPVAVMYEDRIIEFCRKHTGPGSKVAFVAINVNNLEEDKLPAMKVRAKEKGFNFPYAYDPSQKIARDLGATRTPEFFVFDKERKLVYQGALDDNNDPAKAKVNYVEQAVQAVLSGSAPPKSTAPRGCTIKFEN